MNSWLNDPFGAPMEYFDPEPEEKVMRAYHYGFTETGVKAIDAILQAVANAGRAYHHTEMWNVPDGNEPSEVEKIQRAANEAAMQMKGEQS